MGGLSNAVGPWRGKGLSAGEAYGEKSEGELHDDVMEVMPMKL
jgi:hypothetical protein